jgi:hypothetical protein
MRPSISMGLVTLFILFLCCTSSGEIANTDYTIKIEPSNGLAAITGPIEMIGNWTYGPGWTVHSEDNTLYMASGSHLLIFDTTTKTAPVKISDKWFSGIIQDIDVVDDLVFLYTGQGWDTGEASLRILNASDKTRLREIGNYSYVGRASACVAIDDLVYLGDDQLGLRILNISDLTNPQLKTTYASHNIHGMAYENGLIFASRTQFGVQILNVTDLSSIVELTHETVFRADEVYPSGKEMYVASQTHGLVIANITDPTNVTIISSVGDWYGRDVKVQGNYAYSATLDGFRIVDISDIFNPVAQVNFVDIDAEAVSVDGSHAYLAASDGYYIIDVSTPSNPSLVSTIETGTWTNDVTVEGDYAYLASTEIGLQIIDVSDVSNYQEVGRYRDYLMTVEVDDSIAYLAGNFFRILDVSNPANPQFIGQVYVGGTIFGVHVDGNYAYLATYHSGFCVVDISDMSHPTIVGKNSSTSEAFGIDYDGEYVYLATRELGLRVMDISDPTNPLIASELDLHGECYSVQVVGNIAYLANWGRGMDIVNVSNPLNPVLINTYTPVSGNQEVAIEGNLAHVANFDSAYQILNITDFHNITEVASVDLMSRGEAVAIANGLTYVCQSEGNLVSFSHDGDGDGIYSVDEYQLGTNAGLTDSDGDLLRDGDELYVYLTNPANSDTDNDTLDDYEELFVYGTDPLDFDSDDDLMGDGWEIEQGFNPMNPADANGDPDLDLLINVYEFLNGTDPHDNDTDSDILTDYEEVVTYGTNPLSNDTDLDTLDDWSEIFVYETDPKSNDTDSDLIPDNVELDNSLDPNDPSDAIGDLDSDLVSNVDEYLAGTNMQVDDYAPIINSPGNLTILVTGTNRNLVWTSTEPHPDHYNIYKDGVLIRIGSWNATSESIYISLEGLTEGVYEFQIVMYDSEGNNATDTVYVTVLSDWFGVALPYVFTGVAIAVVVIVLVIKKRKT